MFVRIPIDDRTNIYLCMAMIILIYYTREENSRMQSAEPYRDTKLQMKKVKLAKSTD